MHIEWNESLFDSQHEEPSVYWVCFWTRGGIGRADSHDPQRITGAESVEEVLGWALREKGQRGFELFVETEGHGESREHGWIPYRKLIRLAGDFRPAGTEVTVLLSTNGE